MFPSPSRSVSKWQAQAVAIKQLKPDCKLHRLRLLCFMLITSVISRVAVSTIFPCRNHDTPIKNTSPQRYTAVSQAILPCLPNCARNVFLVEVVKLPYTSIRRTLRSIHTSSRGMRCTNPDPDTSGFKCSSGGSGGSRTHVQETFALKELQQFLFLIQKVIN